MALGIFKFSSFASEYLQMALCTLFFSNIVERRLLVGRTFYVLVSMVVYGKLVMAICEFYEL